MNKTLILTGCAGFIGFNFLKYFITQRHTYKHIFSIDKLGYATELTKIHYFNLCEKNSIVMFNDKVSTLHFDDDPYFNSILDHSDCFDILDFASESHVDNSIDKPFVIFEENSMIPAFLIRTLGIKKIERYYHISTDEVYGDLPLKYRGCDRLGCFRVNSPYRPSNPYSASKVAQDAYLEAMSRTFGLNVTLIRMANQYGPYQHYEKMIPISLQRAFNGKKIGIYGKGENCRQWTYVEDTVKIISDIVLKNIFKKTAYHIIHIADRRTLMSNNEMVQTLCKVLKEFKLWHEPEYEYITDRPGHDMMYCLDVEQDVQDYYETRSFEDGLRSTIRFYLDRKK
jgi:dTDP-glucose 4,6-dehydratase